ncbi:MAG: ABC transporter ATP-binding protein [Anaeromyxobacteraceae bacterium]
MEPAISIEQLSKRYGPHAAAGTLLALDRIELEIPRGQFFSILGPSGCGKSTLLHAIDGLASAEGTIRVNGRPVTGPGLDRGVVFQDYALFPWRTVLENVAFGLEIKRLPAAERTRIAREQLALVGLSGFEHRYPAQLSGGMKQRVAIARALAFDPDVLLMDEPFAALDAQTREILQAELLRIWERTGKTVVFVTHSIDEAVFLSQRVAVMTARPGRIKEILEIDLPARTDRDLRSTPEFAALRHRAWELLSAEVAAAREAPPVPLAGSRDRRGAFGAFRRLVVGGAE